MSTRAGLFRAWAVATVVWVGAVSFVAVQNICQDVGGSRYIYIPGEHRFEPYDVRRPEIDDGTVTKLVDGSELYYHRSFYQYGEDRESVIYEFWEHRWHRYWLLLEPWLLLIALPGLLFILVYALLWVVDGFGTATSS